MQYALHDVRTTGFDEGRTQVAIARNYGQLHMYTQGSLVEMQTPKHWNIIGRSMTAPQLLLSPSTILPAPSPYCALNSARQNSALF